MSGIFKITGFQKRSCSEGDDDGDNGYDYAPAACLEGDGDDNDADYGNSPAASMEGDDDDGDYDYAPAARINSLEVLDFDRFRRRSVFDRTPCLINSDLRKYLRSWF